MNILQTFLHTIPHTIHYTLYHTLGHTLCHPLYPIHYRLVWGETPGFMANGIPVRNLDAGKKPRFRLVDWLSEVKPGENTLKYMVICSYYN